MLVLPDAEEVAPTAQLVLRRSQHGRKVERRERPVQRVAGHVEHLELLQGGELGGQGSAEARVEQLTAGWQEVAGGGGWARGGVG